MSSRAPGAISRGRPSPPCSRPFGARTRSGRPRPWCARRRSSGPPQFRNLVMLSKPPLKPLAKKAKKGFRGYPVGTIAFYGPDDKRATKVAVGIILGERQEAADLRRWFSDTTDVRSDPQI